MSFPKFRNLPLGLKARGTINKEKSFRVRTGNGYYGSVSGQKYQDVFNYKVPTDPKTEAMQANRAKFGKAMDDALALPDEEREIYRKAARREGRICWFNIFIREQMAL